jgi:hypothetical protein
MPFNCFRSTIDNQSLILLFFIMHYNRRIIFPKYYFFWKNNTVIVQKKCTLSTDYHRPRDVFPTLIHIWVHIAWLSLRGTGVAT